MGSKPTFGTTPKVQNPSRFSLNMTQRQIESQNKIEVHDWEHKIDLLYKQMESEFSTANFELIKKYDREMVSQGIKKPTRYVHLSRLKNLTRLLKKDWKEAAKEDMKNIIFQIMDRYSDDGQDTEYTYDHKKVLKIFMRWYKLGNRSYQYCLKKYKNGDPDETEDIVMKKPKSRLKGDDLISDEEREWLLDACGNQRDKAIIDVALDGGIRPGELLTLRIKNVTQDKKGYVINVEGKTGVRAVRLIQSTANLARWISEHPFKENPNAPLWIILEKTKYGQHLTYNAVRSLLGRTCDKLKEKHPQFDKRVFLNLFRHTEATKTAKWMSHAITKKRHGWSPGSKMPDRYQHLINADVDEVIFDHYGIETGEEEKPKLPLKCPICQMINPAGAISCSQCGRPLDLESAIKLEENEKSKYDKLSKDFEEFKDEVKSYIKEIREKENNNS